MAKAKARKSSLPKLIEHAARTMTDWSDKQYFLNTVYERFFQGYSVKLADTMGIVYTGWVTPSTDSPSGCHSEAEAMMSVQSLYAIRGQSILEAMACPVQRTIGANRPIFPTENSQ